MRTITRRPLRLQHPGGLKGARIPPWMTPFSSMTILSPSRPGQPDFGGGRPSATDCQHRALTGNAPAWTYSLSDALYDRRFAPLAPSYASPAAATMAVPNIEPVRFLSSRYATSAGRHPYTPSNGAGWPEPTIIRSSTASLTSREVITLDAGAYHQQAGGSRNSAMSGR